MDFHKKVYEKVRKLLGISKYLKNQHIVILEKEEITPKHDLT